MYFKNCSKYDLSHVRVKMKFLSLLFVFLINTSHALEYRAFCSGNRGKVAISFYSSKDRLYLRYNNLMGADDFPLYEGVVTKLTLPVIKIAEEELSSLDQEVLVSWPIEKCDFNDKDPLIMQCGGEAQFHLPLNTNLTSYTLITSRVKEESLTNVFDMFKIRWGIDSPDFHHSLALPFDPKLCQASLKR
ncbi:hypothetical protein DOM21_11860 [Bacteriovorax stolpii]|uniref:Uncharacterized protein n=2 Tax=Bacteriovorax stolpii TaxID=960 RepID=A0A2K9NT14_BACTC|nr:hypothetical protein C0V70_07140 [Bacteriovorax stolpii]QDK42130.1 hypothetical protein DOM21_11860 [Bacteriovorax stolpii]TDP51715.1 hypothetical protein C8D79_3160 [Bacteriovorax stolpii]